MDVADEVVYERMRKILRKKEEKVESTRRYFERLKERGYSHSLPAYGKSIKEAERDAAYARRELNAFEREHDLPISVAREMSSRRIYENFDSARYENLKHDFYTANDEYEIVRREYNDMLRSGKSNLSVLQKFGVANNKMKLAQSRLLVVEEGIPASVAKLKVDEAQRELNRSIEIMRGAPRTGTEFSRPRAKPTVVRNFSGNLVHTELSATQINVLEATRKKLAEGKYNAKEIAKESGVQVSSVYSMLSKLRQQGIDIPTLQEVRSEGFRKLKESRELQEKKYGETQPKALIAEELPDERIAEPAKPEIASAEKPPELREAENKVHLAFNQLSAAGQRVSAEKIAAITGYKTKDVYYCIRGLRAKGLIPPTSLGRFNLELTGRHLQPLSAKGNGLPDKVITSRAGDVLDAYRYLKTIGKWPDIQKISERTGMDPKKVQNLLISLRSAGVGIDSFRRLKVGKARIAESIREHGLNPEELLGMQDEWIREEAANGPSWRLELLRRERKLSGPLARKRGRPRKTAA